MSVYVVTWNINKERDNYDQARKALIAKIDEYDNIQDKGLESVRWISTSLTVTELYSSIKEKLDDNDRLFISKIDKGFHKGWLRKSTWDWIKERL